MEGLLSLVTDIVATMYQTSVTMKAKTESDWVLFDEDADAAYRSARNAVSVRSSRRLN